MTFANNFDLDEAPQKVEPHLRSKLFDTEIIYLLILWMKIINFWRRKIIKIYSACKRAQYGMAFQVSGRSNGHTWADQKRHTVWSPSSRQGKRRHNCWLTVWVCSVCCTLPPLPMKSQNCSVLPPMNQLHFSKNKTTNPNTDIYLYKLSYFRRSNEIIYF